VKIWKLILIIFAIAIGVYLGFPVFRFIKSFNELGRVEAIEPGTALQFSTFAAKNLKTGKIDTLKLRETTVINFWASWCKPCLLEQKSLERFADAYPDLKFIQLSFDNEINLRRILNSLKWKLPAYWLGDTSYFKQPEVLPMTLFLKDSIVLKQWWGAQNWQDTSVANLVDAMRNR
jgi:thiol-disulfide isomerase/thioredoxin